MCDARAGVVSIDGHPRDLHPADSNSRELRSVCDPLLEHTERMRDLHPADSNSNELRSACDPQVPADVC